MPTKLLTSSIKVDGPAGQQVRVLFYSDGSISFRVVKGGPMVLTEAYLQGSDKDVIVEVTPAQ